MATIRQHYRSGLPPPRPPVRVVISSPATHILIMSPGTRTSCRKSLVGIAAILLTVFLSLTAGCTQGPSAVAPGQDRVPPLASPPVTVTGSSPVTGSVKITAADTAMLFLTYQPVKCAKTPWMAWEEASGRRYIRAPSEEEIIAHYYAAEHNVTVHGVAKAYLHMASCEACNVCRESYWFELTARKDEAAPLIAGGWEPAA